MDPEWSWSWCWSLGLDTFPIAPSVWLCWSLHSTLSNERPDHHWPSHSFFFFGAASSLQTHISTATKQNTAVVQISLQKPIYCHSLCSLWAQRGRPVVGALSISVLLVIFSHTAVRSSYYSLQTVWWNAVAHCWHDNSWSENKLLTHNWIQLVATLQMKITTLTHLYHVWDQKSDYFTIHYQHSIMVLVLRMACTYFTRIEVVYGCCKKYFSNSSTHNTVHVKEHCIFCFRIQLRLPLW